MTFFKVHPHSQICNPQTTFCGTGGIVYCDLTFYRGVVTSRDGDISKIEQTEEAALTDLFLNYSTWMSL